MKGLLKKFEDQMVAVAFAEAGEFETAKEILMEKQSLAEKIESLRCEVGITINDLTSMAIAFAEAGEQEEAVRILKEAENRLQEIKENHQKKFLSPAMGST